MHKKGMYPEDKTAKKHKFTLLEKLAIIIIVILLVIILLLLFNKQLREYFEMFKAWYESA